jgi:hypothetical protein
MVANILQRMPVKLELPRGVASRRPAALDLNQRKAAAAALF